jgi:hypothetical protein
MTQSYNLSQLANNLTSAGLLDAADGLVNAVPIANGGTNATTASAARTNLDVAQAIYSVPSGGIIMWSGSVGSIPTGWFLCNGANGTPDLRNRFIVGAGSTYAVGASGGSADAIVVSHTHTATSTVTDSGHAHDVQLKFANGSGAGYSVANGALTGSNLTLLTPGTNSATTGISVSTSNTSAGVSGTNANLPPYYALCWIMKS